MSTGQPNSEDEAHVHWPGEQEGWGDESGERMGEQSESNDRSGLPTEAQAVVRQLQADAARLESESFSLQRIEARLTLRATQLSQTAAQQGSRNQVVDPPAIEAPAKAQTRLVVTQHAGQRGVAQTQGGVSTMKSPSQAVRRVLGGAFAVAAIAIVIAALIGVLFNARQAGHASAHQPTRTSGAQRGWQELTGFAYHTNYSYSGLPAVAPSDPQIAYETSANGSQNPQPGWARRTTNGGHSWQTLPLPVPALHIFSVVAGVNPLHASVTTLDILDDVTGDCSAHVVFQFGGGSGCELQYISMNGGETWAPVRLPLTHGAIQGALQIGANNGGIVGAPLFTEPHMLAASDGRLYGALGCTDATGSTTCVRLVTSVDNGLTWQFADQSIMSSPMYLCDFAVAAGGTTVYAVTTTRFCSFAAQTPLSFWRSDDAGAHWSAVGTLPTPTDGGMWAARLGGGAQPALYMAQPRTIGSTTDKGGNAVPTVSASPSDVKVSVDGGASWQSAPTSGVPAGMKAYFVRGLLGALPDGSIAVQFIPAAVEDDSGGSVIYTWKPGEATWTALADAPGQLGSMQVSPDDTALYFVTMNNSGVGDTYSVWRFGL